MKHYEPGFELVPCHFPCPNMRRAGTRLCVECTAAHARVDAFLERARAERAAVRAT